MRNSIRWVVLCALLISGAGCLETKEDFQLNPDGSGKVVHEAVLQPMNLNAAAPEASPEDQLRELAAGELKEAKGVEAWRDVSFGRKDDGRVWFKGTAYFPDVTKLNFHNAGVKIGLTEIVLDRANGKWALELGRPAKKPMNDKSTAAAPKLTEEQITTKVATEKAKFQQMRPMLTAMMATLKIEREFHVPGPVTSATNFQKTDTGGYRLTLEGAKFLAAIDRLVNDDAWWRKMVASGTKFKDADMPASDEFNEQLFGAKGPVRIEANGATQPLFDYKKEVAAAQAARPAMMAKLKLDAAVAAPPVTKGAFRSLRVAGVQWVSESDQKRNLRPFNQEVGYSLSLIGEFDGAVREVTGGEVDTAVTDAGIDLLPEKEWNRKLHFPRLSKEQTAVVFEIKLESPPEGTKRLKEVAGFVEYMAVGEAKPVELGITKFQANTKGNQFDAVLVARGESKWNKGSDEIQLRVRLPRHAVKELVFYDSQGKKLDVKATGTSFSDRETTLSYALEGQFPDAGKVVAEVFADTQPYRVPFRIQNVSLLGKMGE